jgi:sugar-specific transcriptional regulator TrmB
MIDAVELLKKVGLTEYEAKVYLSLINKHVDGVTRLSEESKVPRTKIYSVLESLRRKGWIRIYSGYPLLFRAIHPRDVFDRLKEDYDIFLNSISSKITEETMNMNEKYVITNYNIGLENLKREVGKAKTIWISNATTDLLNLLSGEFGNGAQVQAILFPGEERIDDENIEFKEAMLRIVHMVKGKETPSSSVILDEERVFTAFKDPTNGKYVISEMLYDDCTQCFGNWYKLAWGE